LKTTIRLAGLAWDRYDTRLLVRSRAYLDVLGPPIGFVVFVSLSLGCYFGWRELEADWLRWTCAAGAVLLCPPQPALTYLEVRGKSSP
jgi:hypothetical protein